MRDRLDKKLCLCERVGPCCHEGQAGQEAVFVPEGRVMRDRLDKKLN